MFENASRLKLRFNHKGLCTVEDLWDLSLTDLDRIFKGMNAELKTQNEESLLDTKTKETEIQEVGIAIVKHIVATKIQEKKEREDRLLRVERKQKLLGIIASKQDAELEGKSIEELNKLIDEM